MSPPERLLWTRLKGGALGVRFRKQHPLGPFVVDFYCASARLVIEVDGMCHEGRALQDAARSAYLLAHAIDVIRFTGREVMKDVAEVVSAIRYELDRRSSFLVQGSASRSSPKGEVPRSSAAEGATASTSCYQPPHASRKERGRSSRSGRSP